MLKSQDLALVTWLAMSRGEKWTYQQLSVDLALSVSEVHAATRRARQARLLVDRNPVKSSLLALLEHAFRHVYFAQKGTETRGLPTGACASPLNHYFPETNCNVWPDPEGHVRGQSFKPLYKRAPTAAKRDTRVYELLVLLDGLRDESTRVRRLALDILEREIHGRAKS